MTQHTPTPWRISEKDKDEVHAVDGLVSFAATSRRTKEQDEANAAFIVKACNAFEPMKDVLEAVLVTLTGKSFIGTDESSLRAGCCALTTLPPSR